MRDLSIYIHIPFCVRKCLYCDFLSFAVSGGRLDGAGEDTALNCHPGTNGKCGAKSAWDPAKDVVESYVNLLKREIIAGSAKYRNHRVVSVFWGGGTPSLLAAEAVSGLMETVKRYYRLSPDAEVTMEANPGTVTADKLRQYITSGINRLSIGLQSANDEELARIGRIHDYRTFQETYRLARQAGFRNINIDLMAALPGQSVDSYAETLKRIAELAPEHISAYSLILEEGTPLYERREEYRFPTEDEDREMYLLTGSCLASHGYHRYEISNYAREGYECRHNKVYWQRGDYAGFGLGAASMVENVRWSNPAGFEEYGGYIAGMDVRKAARAEMSAHSGRIPAPEGECARSGRMPAPEGECARSGRMPAPEGECAHSGRMPVPEGECARSGRISVPEEGGLLSGRIPAGGKLCVSSEEETPQDRHALTRREQMEEFMFLGLRMMRGVSRRTFEELYGRQIEEVYGEVLDRLCRQELLVCESDYIKLTARGIDVSNYVMAEFLLDSYE